MEFLRTTLVLGLGLPLVREGAVCIGWGFGHPSRHRGAIRRSICADTPRRRRLAYANSPSLIILEINV
ncbi:unnamed protein product [Pieris brassicae]|uniref:Secreted protein n=1 Tax=Pieris brassicae TaxID=7116 RepID=A0A9P0XAU9_PIEBR|nr:unnamed protein product [Pieris brassicae]